MLQRFDWKCLRQVLVALVALLCAGLTADSGFARPEPEAKASRTGSFVDGLYSASTNNCPPVTVGIVPSPSFLGATNSLEEIDAASSVDAWAVGNYRDSAGAQRPMVQHWDGTRWGLSTIHALPSNAILNSIEVISSSDVWAVGSQGGQGLAMHWDGTEWTIHLTPGATSLRAVSSLAPDDVWAVGGNTVIHWDGIRWSLIAVPPPCCDGNSGLADIDVISENEVWVVGTTYHFDGKSHYYYNRALRWNGTQWAEISPPSWGYYNGLGEVEATSAGDVWAAGSLNTAPTLFRWNGTQWQTVPAPHSGYVADIEARTANDVLVAFRPGQTSSCAVYQWNGTGWRHMPGNTGCPNAIVPISENDVLAVGTHFEPDPLDPQTGRNLAHAERWDGTQWETVPSESPGRDGSNLLFDVEAVSPDDIWAVGYYSTYAQNGRHKTLALHWDGEEWNHIPSPNYLGNQTSTLTDVSAISSNDVWAVGYAGDPQYEHSLRGLLMHWDGTSWTLVDSPWSSILLNSVEMVSATDGWAVGYFQWTSGGSTNRRVTIFRWDGTRWSVTSVAEPPGSNAWLNDVVATSPTDVWAVGVANERSLIMHYDGNSFHTVPSPNVGTERNILRSVTATGPNDVWAVGYYGPPGTGETLIMHWDGSEWQVIPSPNAGDISFLLGVDAASPDEVWAVGNYFTGGVPQALAMAWNGRQWTLVESQSASAEGNYLNSVAALGGNRTWAVGNYTSDGVTYTLIERLARSPFLDVPPNHTFYSYVYCMSCKGIISGYPDGTFRPNNNVTRGQLSKIVSNSAGFTEPPGAQMFEDVPPGSTFYDWVNRLARRGHIGGYACGGVGEPCGGGNLPYFRPNLNATRGQISKIVSNAAGFTEPVSGQTFEDVPTTNPFYEWIERLASRGVMSGYPCGAQGEPCAPGYRPYFRWATNATRGQTSKIVVNTFFPNCQSR
jgi:photosystem II stability/assembly factor-like uncharacterized protein